MESPIVMTVLGPVPASALGTTHAHEHLVAHPPGHVVERDADLDLGVFAPVLDDLRRFAGAGGGAIVEMTTVDYGRDVGALADVSLRTGVHVIAATGFNRDVYCADWCAGADPEALAREQIGEIVDGVGRASVRPGVVKFATGVDAASPAELVALRAAAITHRETGTPIFTHTEAGGFAFEQLELLGREGVAPSGVTLGHLDRRPDVGLHVALARAGAFLSFDQIPKPKYATEAGAIASILALRERGLHGQVVVGGDFARRSMFVEGGPGLSYLSTVFAARLRAAAGRQGFDGEDLVEAVLRRNPQRALSRRT
jgi:phosphotriesterase-related protein